MPHHQGDAAEAQHQTSELGAVDALVEQRHRQRRGQQRLHADDESGNAGFETEMNGREHASQVDAVEQQSGNHRVQHVGA